MFPLPKKKVHRRRWEGSPPNCKTKETDDKKHGADVRRMAKSLRRWNPLNATSPSPQIGLVSNERPIHAHPRRPKPTAVRGQREHRERHGDSVDYSPIRGHEQDALVLGCLALKVNIPRSLHAHHARPTARRNPKEVPRPFHANLTKRMHFRVAARTEHLAGETRKHMWNEKPPTTWEGLPPLRIHARLPSFHQVRHQLLIGDKPCHDPGKRANSETVLFCFALRSEPMMNTPAAQDPQRANGNKDPTTVHVQRQGHC